MFRNYFKMALRNLVKYPGFSLLNIAGLTLGIASSFVILIYVWQELSTDKGFKDYKRIYRVATDFFDMGGFANSQQVLHEKLENYKSIEAATIFQRGYQEIPVEVNSVQFNEPYNFQVDSNYFKVFSYQFIEGSAATVMRSPDEAVLTESLAKKYFGNKTASGNVIRIGKDKKVYRVTGVVTDSKDKTHLLANLWTPVYNNFGTEVQWNQAGFYNYVKLSPGADEKDLKKILDDILKRNVYPASGSTQSYAQWRQDPKSVRFFIQPLKNIYLYSNYKFEVSPGGSPTQIYILGIIGIFIILIAVVNYINLTTARSSVRAKEVGIKKTLGASRKSLVLQFLLETFVISIVAMALAVITAKELVIFFEYISRKAFISSLFLNWQQPAILFAFVLFIGLASGLYPAFYLTAFTPKKILKGDLSMRGNKNFRSVLVVFQFTLAIGLIIATLVMYSQLNYMRTKDKGFDEQGVLVIKSAGALGNKAEAFRQAIAGRSEVLSTSFNSREPAGKSIWMYTFQTPAMKESITIQTFPVDEDYIPTLELHLLQGRNFSKQLATDSNSAILNEAAVKELGLKNPIGAQINQGQRVNGVIGDFNFESLKSKISPVVLLLSKKGYSLAVRLNGRSKVAGFLGFLRNEWKSFSPDEPLKYNFLDENFAALAEKDRILSKAATFFTVLALVIACIGLFALAMFTAEQRSKEISIRKLLGANVRAIVSLLSMDFIKLVFIAALIASPVAWYSMNSWLQDFAYRVNIGAWIFISAIIMVLLVALVTVSFQAVKAAIANPVKNLRTE
jgi:putative ABC transport system permease protein